MNDGKSSVRSLMSASRSAAEEFVWLDATHAAKICKAASIITYDVMVAPQVALIIPRIPSSANRILSSVNEYDPSVIVICASLSPAEKEEAPPRAHLPRLPLGASAGEGPPQQMSKGPPPTGFGSGVFPRSPAASLGNCDKAPSGGPPPDFFGG